jgi:hypothetical protein
MILQKFNIIEVKFILSSSRKIFHQYIFPSHTHTLSDSLTDYFKFLQVIEIHQSMKNFPYRCYSQFIILISIVFYCKLKQLKNLALKIAQIFN